MNLDESLCYGTGLLVGVTCASSDPFNVVIAGVPGVVLSVVLIYRIWSRVK